MRNERIHQEMQSADQIRASIEQKIKERALANLKRDSFGALQQSGIKGVLDDIYRRCIENPYYGKDIFDGRFQSDTQQLGTNYDQRAQFYGLDKAQDQERDRGEDLER
jgi:hypothetical protein